MMNHKVLPVLFSFFVLLFSYGKERDFSRLSAYRKWDIADSYREVAARFNDLGQKKRARAFKATAESIYPETKEAASPAPPESGPKKKEKPKEEVKPSPKVINKVEQKRQVTLSRYYFSKLLRGVLAEDVSKVGELFAEEFRINETVFENKPETFESFFKQYPGLKDLSPSIYDLSTMVVKKDGNTFEIGIYPDEKQLADHPVLKDLGFRNSEQTFSLEKNEQKRWVFRSIKL